MWVGQLRVAGCRGIDKADGLSEREILFVGLTPPFFILQFGLTIKHMQKH